MDPRYLDLFEVDSLALHPCNKKRVVQQENSGETRVGLGLFRLVSLLGFSAS